MALIVTTAIDVADIWGEHRLAPITLVNNNSPVCVTFLGRTFDIEDMCDALATIKATHPMRGVYFG